MGKRTQKEMSIRLAITVAIDLSAVDLAKGKKYNDSHNR